MKVYLSSPLRSYTGGASEVSGAGETVDALLHDLDRQHPGLRYRMVDEQRRIRRHMRVFVNEVQTFDLEEPLAAGDRIQILSALSGG